MENNQRNSRKRLNSLILLVAFTAVMLIVSTYAWFSTQRNVTLSGLTGKVKVAEGLQISLDATTWANEIDLAEIIAKPQEYFQLTGTNDAEGNPQYYNLANPYSGGTNYLPDEYYMNPVSTTGTEEIGVVGEKEISFYSGKNTNGIVLSDITTVSPSTTAGYYAIDFFLENSSSKTVPDKLVLNSASSVTILENGSAKSGIQNTIRVAFAIFDNDTANPDWVNVNKMPTAKNIIDATTGDARKINDVAIWEPNASGADCHVDYIVKSNNRITWSDADKATLTNMSTIDNTKFTSSSQIPTYALTKASVPSLVKDENNVEPGGDGYIETYSHTTIDNIYDWKTPATGLKKQYTLQTATTGVTQQNLVSAKDGTTQITIPASTYVRCRMYVWLEGQDPDCINYASHGGGVTINVGLEKPENVT